MMLACVDQQFLHFFGALAEVHPCHVEDDAASCSPLQPQFTAVGCFAVIPGPASCIKSLKLQKCCEHVLDGLFWIVIIIIMLFWIVS
jgi:hypothetical protein